ncbi:hypothetical protein BGZ47_003104, partial [Haplosporangium gracile]
LPTLAIKATLRSVIKQAWPHLCAAFKSVVVNSCQNIENARIRSIQFGGSVLIKLYFGTGCVGMAKQLSKNEFIVGSNSNDVKTFSVYDKIYLGQVFKRPPLAQVE